MSSGGDKERRRERERWSLSIKLMKTNVLEVDYR